jgi:radical SAM superfamily enzyme YgiQ (UPF0313 family)
MKVLLINPNFRGSKKTYDVNIRLRQPLDLAYISAILEKKRIYNEILDANALDLSEKEILDKIDKFNPSHLIITTTPIDRWECPQIDIDMVFSLITKINPLIKIIVYGTHGTVDPLWVWKKSNKRIDYIIKGEPEKPVSELFDSFLVGSSNCIKGISYKKGDDLLINNDYNVYGDIDQIPTPNFKKLNMNLYEYNGEELDKPFSILLSSRGCPFRCTFCLRAMFPNYRAHSPERVIEEIKYLKDHYSINSIFFQDWEFLIDKERVRKLAQLMKRNNLYVNFGINARARDLDLELVKNLKEVGLKRINIGLESASNKILKAVKKDITKEDLIRSVELSKKVGVKIGYYGLYNLPGEDINTIKETAKFIADNGLEFRAGVVRPYPGTELAKGNNISWENINTRAGRIKTKFNPTITKLLYKFFINYYRDGPFFLFKIKNLKKIPSFFERFLKYLL